MNEQFNFFKSWIQFQALAANISRVLVRNPDLRVEHWAGSEVHPIPTLVYAVDMHLRIKVAENDYLDLQAGEAVIFNPGVIHQHIEPRHLGMYYTQGFLETYSDFKLVDQHNAYRGGADRSHCWAAMQKIINEASNEQRCLLLMQLINEIEAEGINKANAEHPAAQRMHHFIGLNFQRDIDLDDIIKASGLASAQAFAVYKQSYGLTPLHHLLKRRVYMAQAYLRSGMERKLVAERSGFKSSRQMNRAFHKFYGKSPRDWLNDLKADLANADSDK